MIRSLLQKLSSIALLSLVGSAGMLAHAASQATPQITEAVNAAQRVTLKGNVHPLLRRAHDLGIVSPSTQSGRMLLVLKRPQAQEVALEQFLSDVHTPGSASYHKWLTPAQFGERFGPADSDVQAVVAWLQSQGFRVAHVSAGKTNIEFSGTTGQIQSAFRTAIHSYSINGEHHLANATDPQIPAALAPVVAGVSTLNDFRPRPMHTTPVARTAQRVNNGPRPTVTIPNGGYYVGPSDAATIYNTPNSSLNTHFNASKSLDGSGVTIAIAGVSNIDTTDVDNYRTVTGLPKNTPTVIVDGADPGVVGDSAVEALLDTEVSGAIAPAAAVKLYIAADTTLQSGLNLAIQRALDDNTASILNVSFGLCEAAFGAAANQQVYNYWQQAAAQGISVTVSTGDSGSAGCDDQNTETAAYFGLQVNGLASTPYNIAVGGTDFNLTTANASQYWNSTNGAGLESALKYIPEIPWNDSTNTIGPLSGNTPFQDPNNNNQTNIVGAGGGASGCLNPQFDNAGNFIACATVSGTSSAGYPKPSWQTAAGTTSTRDVPDVSLFASDGFHNATWFTCLSGTRNGTPYTDCVPDSSNSFTFSGVGGTSAAAPAMAGILALVDQQYGAQGQADYVLYPLAAQHGTVFHDVTTGNNSVVCTTNGAPSFLQSQCGANGFLTGYDTAAGYDLATGLGSMDVTQLVSNWNAITFKPSTTALQLNGSTASLTITHGTAVNVSASVTSTGGTPTGNVAIVNSSTQNGSNVAPSNGTTQSPSILTLTNGTATSSYPYFPGGTYTVSANYGGDGSFAPSTSNAISITVNPEASVLNLFVDDFDANNQGHSVAGTTVPYGTYVSIDAQPVGVSQQNSTNPATATGTVTFTNNGSNIGNEPVNVASNGYAEVPGQVSLYYTPGNYSIGASYSGDASLHASTAGPLAFTVAKAPTALSATAASNAPIGSAAYTVVITPNPASNAASPTGNITITDGATGVGSPVAVTAAQDQNTGASLAAANIVIDPTTLPAGVQTLTLTYSGDGNYTGSTGTIQVTGTGTGGGKTPNYTLAVKDSTLTIANSSSSNNSGQTTVTLTPVNSFTGSVNFTCAVTGAATQLLPTCSLANPSVNVSGTVTNTLTVTATPPGSAALHSPIKELEDHWLGGSGAVLACLFLFGIPGRRRALERAGWQRTLGVLLLIVTAGLAGCGGGSSNPKSPGTPAGAYTVTVTATSGSITQTATVAVTIQ